MECISPPELDNTQLLRHLDGDADNEVEAHLARCQHCRARATELAQLQDALMSHVYRITCPTTMELGEYHLGLLSPHEIQSIQTHVSTCPHCQAELTSLGEFMAQVSPEPRSGLLEQVTVLIAQLVDEGLGRSALGPLPQVPVGGGIRDRGRDGGPRSYKADDVQVVIDLVEQELRSDRNVILGLVMSKETQDMEVYLWKAGEMVAKTIVDEGGNFMIADLLPGIYELILKSTEQEIHIRDLEI